MAAELLRQKLNGAGRDDVTVVSAGTGAWEGAPVSEGAYLVSLERGLDLSSHAARLLSRELVETADLIFTMARHHRSRVEELGGEGKVHLLGEYAGLNGPGAEVSDPFGGELVAYRETLMQLSDLLDTVAARLDGEHPRG